jgi:hypothetical protein
VPTAVFCEWLQYGRPLCHATLTRFLGLHAAPVADATLN